MARRRTQQPALWGDSEEPRGYRPPTPAQLAERVAEEIAAQRVRWYERFGVVPPPVCPSHGRHEGGVMCDACAETRAADARVREVLVERSALVEQGFTWARGRMELWTDVEDDVRYGAREVPP